MLGARQVGKTTLVEHVLRGEAARFLNFDVEIDKAHFLAALAAAEAEALRMLGAPKVLVLDEAQRLPETARIVKGWHDAKAPARLVLFGSSSLDLLDQSAESLTGRNLGCSICRVCPNVFHAVFASFMGSIRACLRRPNMDSPRCVFTQWSTSMVRTDSIASRIKGVVRSARKAGIASTSFPTSLSGPRVVRLLYFPKMDSMMSEEASPVWSVGILAASTSTWARIYSVKRAARGVSVDCGASRA